MKADLEKDELIFSSGKGEYANLCIIGIAPDLTISGGYDNGFPMSGWDLTKAEREELADYMIALWTKFKEQP